MKDYIVIKMNTEQKDIGKDTGVKMERTAKIKLNCGNCPLQKDEEELIYERLQHELNKKGIVIEDIEI